MEAVDLDSEQDIQEESFSTEIFFEVLGLISPAVIESMTAFSGGGKKDPLVDILSEYLDLDEKKVVPSEDAVEDDGKAKILPFVNAADNKQESESGNSTSSFIFKEKKRAEKVQRKIKGKEIIELYQKSSKVNVKQERALKEDLSKSYQIGVLINKRQY